MARYVIDGRCWDTTEEGFEQALAEAHAARARPLCVCRPDGVPMYVARFDDGFLVKRMPFTGSLHAPDCVSFEPPAEWSGLGQVLGSAITEDPASGLTALKLGFSLSKTGGRLVDAGGGEPGDSVSSDGNRLSLRGLLHYLWDQAELTRWHPGFAGKRSWATVRRHLLGAAANKVCRGQALAGRLYVPEVFAVERREAINARRAALFGRAVARPNGPRPLLLLVGEVKEIAPARHGYKVVVKHVPDQAFAIDEALYRRLTRRFEAELYLWGASDAMHLVMIATFGVNGAGVPAIEELSLMPATAQWIPVEDAFERQLVDRLVREGRSFVKGLRYNLAAREALACAVLTDVGEVSVALWIDERIDDEIEHRRHGQVGDHEAGSAPTARAGAGGDGARNWVWWVPGGDMPALPRTTRWAPARPEAAMESQAIT